MDSTIYKTMLINDNWSNFESKPVKKTLSDLKSDFNGVFEIKTFSNCDWKECTYCNKYYPKDIFLQNLEYCGHCWSWFNFNQLDLDLERCIYTGDNTINEVKDFLKLTFKLHPINCNINDCIYNKISQYKKEGKLNEELSKYLGFKSKNKIYNRKIKLNERIEIDYNLSSISI